MKVIREWIKYEIKHEQQLILAYIFNEEHNSSWLFRIVYALTMHRNMIHMIIITRCTHGVVNSWSSDKYDFIIIFISSAARVRS